jgi:hypothetical protein
MGCRFMWGSRGIDLGLERRGCRDDDTDRPFFPAPTICHVRWSSVAKNEHLQLPIARLRLAKRRHTKSKYLDAVFFTFFMLLYPTLRLFLSSVASPYRTLSLVLEGRVRAVICQFFLKKRTIEGFYKLLSGYFVAGLTVSSTGTRAVFLHMHPSRNSITRSNIIHHT